MVVALVVTGCGSSAPSDQKVASDLYNALAGTHGIIIAVASDIRCAHQSGNGYVCRVDSINDGKLFYDVTDDGQTIAWQPA